MRATWMSEDHRMVAPVATGFGGGVFPRLGAPGTTEAGWVKVGVGGDSYTCKGSTLLSLNQGKRGPVGAGVAEGHT